MRTFLAAILPRFTRHHYCIWQSHEAGESSLNATVPFLYYKKPFGPNKCFISLRGEGMSLAAGLYTTI